MHADFYAIYKWDSSDPVVGHTNTSVDCSYVISGLNERTKPAFFGEI